MPSSAHDPATSADFADAARTLSHAARQRGLVGPSYRCPPRLVGVDRTIRRRGDGAIVSIRMARRPWLAVLADMIEGVIVANRLEPPRSDRIRTELWELAGPTSRSLRPAGGVTDTGHSIRPGPTRAA